MCMLSRNSPVLGTFRSDQARSLSKVKSQRAVQPWVSSPESSQWPAPYGDMAPYGRRETRYFLTLLPLTDTYVCVCVCVCVRVNVCKIWRLFVTQKNPAHDPKTCTTYKYIWYARLSLTKFYIYLHLRDRHIHISSIINFLDMPIWDD